MRLLRHVADAGEVCRSAVRGRITTPDGAAWTTGNDATPLPHGATYFKHLLATIEATVAGDLILFTDWRGDPDEALDGSGKAVSEVLGAAAGRAAPTARN